MAAASASACAPASASASAAPVPVRHASSSSFSSSPASFFQLPNKKRRQNRLMEQQRTEQTAVLEEEASLRTQALVYLDDFLHNSKWTDQLDQIAIVHDAVPTMPELNAYGDLEEKEGTRVCRRLFKAVVVWDELGHTLWKTLRAASEQRQLVQRQFDLLSAATGFPDELFTPAAFTTRRRPSRRSSDDSDGDDGDDDSACSRRSHDSAAGFVSPPPPPSPGKKQRSRLSKKLSTSSSSSSSATPSSASSWRSSSDSESAGPEQHSAYFDYQHPSPPTRHHHHHHHLYQQQPQYDLRPAADPSHSPDAAAARPAHGGEPSLSAFPRILSHNCASAVRRRLGVFGESRSSLVTARQSHGQASHSR